ncbi:MAG: hypothetical protein ACPLTR_01475, partial [Thermacetogeniaceae bacterium]
PVLPARGDFFLAAPLAPFEVAEAPVYLLLAVLSGPDSALPAPFPVGFPIFKENDFGRLVVA